MEIAPSDSSGKTLGTRSTFPSPQRITDLLTNRGRPDSMVPVGVAPRSIGRASLVSGKLGIDVSTLSLRDQGK